MNNKVNKATEKDDYVDTSTDNNSSSILNTNNLSDSSKPRTFSSNHFDLIKLKDEQQKDTSSARRYDSLYRRLNPI
jgi:hypothetical protein